MRNKCVKSTTTRQKEAEYHFIPFWTCCNLMFNAQEDKSAVPSPSWLSLCCICAGQKLKMSISSGLRLLGEFPLVLSQTGWVSQSWGVSPVSRTWGWVRDLARLRIQAKKELKVDVVVVFLVPRTITIICIRKHSDINACCCSGDHDDDVDMDEKEEISFLFRKEKDPRLLTNAAGWLEFSIFWFAVGRTSTEFNSYVGTDFTWNWTIAIQSTAGDTNTH